MSDFTSEPEGARRWYSVEELVEEAMAAADIVGLARWASINQRFRYLIQGIIQRRAKSAVGNFIHGEDLLAFFAVLDKTDSAIGGSVALSVITPHCSWKPRDLNIMAPMHSRERWTGFFNHHGYQGNEVALGELGEHENPRYPVLQATVASAVYIFRHKKIKRDIILIIISNSNSCMTPIIGAQVTSQMTAITSSHIYCLYPALTAERISLRGYYANPADKYSPTALLPDRRSQLNAQNMTYYESSSKFNRKCGLACPDIERTLSGWRGIGVLQWGGYMDSKRSESFLLPDKTLHVAWQLGEWCDNVECDMGRVILPTPVHRGRK